MKYTIKEISTLFNCHKNTIYPQLKKVMPLMLLNSGKTCKRVFNEVEMLVIINYLKKPKKPFIVAYVDKNILNLATILNNITQ